MLAEVLIDPGWMSDGPFADESQIARLVDEVLRASQGGSSTAVLIALIYFLHHRPNAVDRGPRSWRDQRYITDSQSI